MAYLGQKISDASTGDPEQFVSSITVLNTAGATAVIGTPTVTVKRLSNAGWVLEAHGTTVPTNGDAGYDVGCLFLNTSGGVGTTWYINEGTSTSAAFNAVQSSDSGIDSITSGNSGVIATTTSGATTISTGLTIYNNTGSSLTAGQLVYVAGYTTTNGITVALANSSVAGKLAQYVVNSTIANSTSGVVYKVATIGGLVTTGLTIGNLVYTSGSSAGAWTQTNPGTAAITSQVVGTVVVVSSTVGVIAFNLDNVNTTFASVALANASITTTQIASATITGSNIAATTVAGSNIVANTIGDAQLALTNVAGTVTALRVARAVYSFAVDGGLVSTITPVGTVALPQYAVIIGATINSTTAVASAGSATVSVGTSAGSSTTSILTATGKASLGTDVLVNGSVTLAAPVKLTAAGSVTFTIAAAALTAGIIEAAIYYYTAVNA